MLVQCASGAKRSILRAVRSSRAAVALPAAAALGCVAIARALAPADTPTPFRLYGTDQTNHQAPGEGVFFLALFALGTPAAIFLFAALWRGLGPLLARTLDWATARPRAVSAVLALSAAVVAGLISWRTFWHQTFTDDEYAYLFTAKLLLRGHLTAPLWFPTEAFHYQFLAHVGLRQFGIYGVVWPGLVALGLRLGLPQLAAHAAVGVTVIATAGLARELYGARTAVLAAVVTALSPFLLLTGATVHNAVGATALVSLFAWLCARYLARLHARDALLAGLALGAALHVRMLDALAFALPAACLIVARIVRGPERARALAGAAVMAAPVVLGVATFLLLNAELTGDWLRTSYDVFNERWPGAKMFGFGKGPFRYFTNTPEIAFSRLGAQVTRGSFWMFGWPLGALPMLLCRGRRALALAAPIALSLGGYFFYFANSVHDTGPVYYLSLLPLGAVLAARGIEVACARAGDAAIASALAALAVSAGLLFWPREVIAARQVARIIRRPKLAVERAGLHHAFVFPEGMQRRGALDSWVFFPPIPGHPWQDEDIVWVADAGPVNESLLAQEPDRKAWRMRWRGDQPVIEPMEKTK
jgi:hypothetical protein